jgi:hypothetical protein
LRGYNEAYQSYNTLLCRLQSIKPQVYNPKPLTLVTLQSSKKIEVIENERIESDESENACLDEN